MSIFLLSMLCGTVAGTLDITYALSIAYLARKTPPAKLLQYITSGILGAKSYELGYLSAAIGLFLHYAIAIIMAFTFIYAGSHIPYLLSQPLLFGPLYGIVLFVTMMYIVLPLSQTTPKRTLKGIPFVIELLAHMFLVGLPIVWLAVHFKT